MIAPPHGLAMPAAWSHLTRADQIVLVIEGRRVRVDLAGVRSPSPATPAGRDAKAWLEAWLEANAHLMLTVWSPLQTTMQGLLARWGRPLLVGRVFCGTTDLSDLLIAYGHAQPVSGDSPQN